MIARGATRIGETETTKPRGDSSKNSTDPLSIFYTHEVSDAEAVAPVPPAGVMQIVDVIRQKRDGRALDSHAIQAVIRGVTDGSVPDYQATALLMAIVWRGMSVEETAALTTAMVESGERVDLSDVPGIKVDKHSTGGVGDKTSLILAPLAAACGVTVPMMSGRGLGHTGGTLDKLESIPGFSTRLSIAEFRRALREVGCALIGQTSEVAPADRKLYALRDVTATVESIPLITASIMSKKIAEGIDGLVLDVKVGRGAFMKTRDSARALAESLVRTGREAGLRTVALLTAMDQPLGRAVGNSLEVIESLETLKGRGPKDLEELSVLLAARMVMLAGLERDPKRAETKVREQIASGAGVEKFRRIIEHQGGDPRVVDEYDRLPLAPGRFVVEAPRDGVLTGLDAERIGRASMLLGAGREQAEASVDHGVGIQLVAAAGQEVKRGQGVMELYYRETARLDAAEVLASEAIQITAGPYISTPLILETIEEN